MQEFILTHQWIIWLAILWTIPWKGVALWKAAKNSDKTWFVILLIFNALAVLEIVYIFVFSKKVKEYLKTENASSNGGNNLIRGL